VCRPHRPHELPRLCVLEQVAGGAGSNRRQQLVIVEEARQDDHARLGDALAQRAHGRDAVEPRHHQIHQDDVGPQAGRRLDRFLPVGGLTRNLDPLL
jgi:hypothetical protein